MSTNFILPPPTRHPLLASIQRKAAPKLGNFPALALAATATKVALDTEGAEFAAVAGCLETLSRLGLSVSSSWLLVLLVKDGPQTCTALALRMKQSPANITGLTERLLSLELIAMERAQPDRRIVTVSATDAARKVLASVVALTALAAAASVLTRNPNRR